MSGKLAICVGTLLIGLSARAQVASLYVTSSSTRFSKVQTGTMASGAGYQSQYTSFWTSGIGGGVTFNFLPVGPVKLGFDLRGSTRPGTTGADTAMAGLKLAFTPPLIHIKPYVQASGGYVATRTVNVSAGGNGATFGNQYAAWEILGGVDIPLAPFLDLRAIEVGGGQGFDILGSSSTPNISLFTINSGLVLHF
jgi:hypothetical protein